MSLREQRNAELVKMVRAIHEESRFSYGSPRVHAELTLGLGEPINRKRVERLMRQAGIQGIHRRRGRRNQVNEATEEDLVSRDFAVDAPDLLWVTDIERHEALTNRAVVKGHRPWSVAAGRVKQRAA
ncbi:IS3 family transposase [Actinomadura vinacea]|uniref:IS3 family transposase n=1 Tax=Actinomadura vinacea TaxID=115336 RepID=UPI0031DAF3F7